MPGDALGDPVKISGAFMRQELAPFRIAGGILSALDGEIDVLLRGAGQHGVERAVGGKIRGDLGAAAATPFAADVNLVLCGDGLVHGGS
jgi:hypothetical protein